MNTNTTYQDQRYTHEESTQHNDPTKTYNDQYENASQFSNVSQYNTAETAHTNNTYSTSNANPYKTSHQDVNVETTQQGWNPTANKHHTNKPSWGQYQIVSAIVVIAFVIVICDSSRVLELQDSNQIVEPRLNKEVYSSNIL